MLFQHLVIFITISTAMTILNQICLHLLPISNLYSHHFIMCSFNHLSFNNYFHSKGNSKSNSPVCQNFLFSLPFSSSTQKIYLELPIPSSSASKCSCKIFALQQVLHPTLRLLSSLVCLSPAAPPLQAFPQNSNTLSSIYSIFPVNAILC